MTLLRHMAATIVCLGLVMGPGPGYAAGGHGGSASETGDALDTDSAYLAFDPFAVTIFNGSRIAGMMNLKINLRIEDRDERKKISKVMPRLQDAFLRRLNLLAKGHITISHVLDLAMVHRALQAAADGVLGPDIAEVLIYSVTMRKG